MIGIGIRSYQHIPEAPHTQITCVTCGEDIDNCNDACKQCGDPICPDCTKHDLCKTCRDAYARDEE